MSNANILYPLKSELALINVQALEDSRSIYPFNVSAKKIKPANTDTTLAEKYPFTLETGNGYVYEIFQAGASLCKIQLSNTTGLDVAPGTSNNAKKLIPLLKIMLMDENRSLYRTLLHQLVEKQNNQWFLFLLGLRAKRLVEGDIKTINLIDAPKLQVITGDQWIKLTCEVIDDISWGYFPTDERYAIIERFKVRLQNIAAVELLPIMGVNPSAFEKSLDTTFKALEGTPNMTSKVPPEEPRNITANEQLINTQELNNIPTEPFITEQELKDLNYESLLEVIKEKSIPVYEYASQKLKAKPQIISYLKKKGWVITEETKPVEDQATEQTETTEQQ